MIFLSDSLFRAIPFFCCQGDAEGTLGYGVFDAMGRTVLKDYDQKRKYGRCHTMHGDKCAIEWGSWNMLQAVLPPTSTVLECGARYGMTSCQVAEIQNNSGLIMAVEPDPTVYRAIHDNRRKGRCNFGLVHGIVAPAPEYSVPGTGGHGNSLGTVSHEGSRTIPNIELRELERRFGHQFVSCTGWLCLLACIC